MTPEQAAHEARDAIVSLPSRFMTDPATHARGTELGFEGFDFYTAGRGGALGDVPADVVVSAFVFFPPAAVQAAWERSAPLMPRREAAMEWARCAHSWARDHLGSQTDWTRLSELLGRIVWSADVAGAPLFAAWRTLPEPPPLEAKALTVHRLNALRELRGALHGAAVLTVGLRPFEAASVRAPKMMRIMGWQDPPEDPVPLRDRWQLAEARTDRMLGRHFSVLRDTERTELVDALGDAAA